jgi:hypothetical protein
VTAVTEYRHALERAPNPEAYLLAHSGLPGPRANLELALAAAEVCPASELRRWAKLGPDDAPTGRAEEFLAFCGVLGLGRELVSGDGRALSELRRHASDSRWRLREAVAMALQRWGDSDFAALVAAMGAWARGSWLERRAAAAALCEPALLRTVERTGDAIGVLTVATAGIAEASAEDRRSDDFKALRKGLGYCWSVAVAAAPEVARPAFEDLVERAAASGDGDLVWVARENLRKRRLERVDPEWAARLLARIQEAGAARA